MTYVEADPWSAQPPQPQQSQVLRLLLDSSELSLIRSQWMYETSGYKRSLDMLNFSKHFRELVDSLKNLKVRFTAWPGS